MNAVVISNIRVSCSFLCIVIIHRCCMSEIVFADNINLGLQWEGAVSVNDVRTIIHVDYTKHHCLTST